MADAYCSRCGGRLGATSAPESGGLCDSCRLADRAADRGETTRVLASGLTDVATIADLKRALVRLPGVLAVGVQSAPNGRFEYLVRHESGTSLAPLIQALPRWGATFRDHPVDAGDRATGPATWIAPLDRSDDFAIGAVPTSVPILARIKGIFRGR